MRKAYVILRFEKPNPFDDSVEQVFVHAVYLSRKTALYRITEVERKDDSIKFELHSAEIEDE